MIDPEIKKALVSILESDNNKELLDIVSIYLLKSLDKLLEENENGINPIIEELVNSKINLLLIEISDLRNTVININNELFDIRGRLERVCNNVGILSENTMNASINSYSTLPKIYPSLIDDICNIREALEKLNSRLNP